MCVRHIAVWHKIPLRLMTRQEKNLVIQRQKPSSRTIIAARQQQQQQDTEVLPVHRLQLLTEHCQNCHHIITQSLAGG